MNAATMACKPIRKRQTSQLTLMRQWRESQTDYLAQLMQLLPFPDNIKTKLSHTDVLRLTTTVIKVRQIETELSGSVQSIENANLVVDILDGFLLTVDQTGLILYMSNDVNKILGYNMHEMLGVNITDFLYQADRGHFFQHVLPSETQQNGSLGQGRVQISKREFVVRLKYRISNDKNKVLQTGFVGLQMRGILKSFDLQGKRTSLLIVACYPLCLAPSIELSFYEFSFVSRYDKNNRLICADDRISSIIGYDANTYLGTSRDEAWHPQDLKTYFQDHWEFLNQRGSMVTMYRAILHDGRMFEVMSHDTIVFGPKGEKLFIVCVDFIIRRFQVHVKKWPVRKDSMMFGICYGLPGESVISMKTSLDDVIDTKLPEAPYNSGNLHGEMKQIALSSLGETRQGSEFEGDIMDMGSKMVYSTSKAVPEMEQTRDENHSITKISDIENPYHIPNLPNPGTGKHSEGNTSVKCISFNRGSLESPHHNLETSCQDSNPNSIDGENLLDIILEGLKTGGKCDQTFWNDASSEERGKGQGFELKPITPGDQNPQLELGATCELGFADKIDFTDLIHSDELFTELNDIDINMYDGTLPTDDILTDVLMQNYKETLCQDSNPDITHSENFLDIILEGLRTSEQYDYLFENDAFSKEQGNREGSEVRHITPEDHKSQFDLGVTCELGFADKIVFTDLTHLDELSDLTNFAKFSELDDI